MTQVLESRLQSKKGKKLIKLFSIEEKKGKTLDLRGRHPPGIAK